jgi:hypothetical protein
LADFGEVACPFAFELLADEDGLVSRILNLSGLVASGWSAFGEDSEGEEGLGDVDAGSCCAFDDGVDGFAFAEDDTRPGERLSWY